MTKSGGINALPHPVSGAYPFDEQSDPPHTLHIPGAIAPINSLPNELLIKILAQTWFVKEYQTASSRPSVALVCSRWRSIINDCSEFWAAGLRDQTFIFNSWSKPCTFTNLATLLRRSSPRYLDSVSQVLRPYVSRVTSFHIRVSEKWEVDAFHGLLSDDSFRLLEDLQVRYFTLEPDYDEDGVYYYPSISPHETSPLPLDCLPRLRRLVVPGSFLPKTVPASLRHLTVGWDRGNATDHIARILGFQDLRSVLMQCQALETLKIYTAFPEVYGAAPVEYQPNGVLLSALRSLHIEDTSACIGSAVAHLHISANVRVHLRVSERDGSEWIDGGGPHALIEMNIRTLSATRDISHVGLMFWTSGNGSPYVAVVGRNGGEQWLRADVLSSSFNPSAIVEVFPSTSRVTHLSILHLCNTEAARSWDVFLLEMKALVSLDLRGLHVAKILFALQQSQTSDPTHPIAWPALRTLCVDFEASTEGVAEEYLQGEVFIDVETLIRASCGNSEYVKVSRGTRDPPDFVEVLGHPLLESS